MDKKIRKLLYRLFDHTLKPEESARLEEALKVSEELRKEKRQLERIRVTAASMGQNSFDTGFADRVIRQIRHDVVSEEDFFDALMTIFRPISVGVAVVVLFLLSLNFVQSREISLSAALGQPEVTIEEAIDPTLILAME